jgi:CheY-like chemotaxis protein
MINRILIAEDDELMSRLYQKVFNLEGYQVEMAADGQAALDKAREVKPTLILLDIMMPRLNGLDALDKLKADPTLKDVPVVMLTNLAGQQDAESAIAKGAAKYIIKSEHEPKEVAGIIKELLSGSAPGPAPTSPPPTAPPPATPPPTTP